MPSNPILTLQTASLYASNDASSFTGTGGPFGFDPFTAQFGGVISSAGLAGEPFADTVYNVAAGDIVTFVVAIQNMTAGAAAYGVRLKETMPAGFIVPTDDSGIDLSVTDGAGNVLDTSGDLFGEGLVLSPSIAGYDADSGLNVAVVTFTLQAAPNFPGLYATLHPTAAVTGYAASPGGPDLSATTPSVSTTVIAAAPTPVVTPETDPTALAKGQTVAFDVALTIPAGTLQDLRITPVLPSGTAMLDLVSASILSLGNGLTLGTPQVTSSGSILLGNVTASPSGNNTVTARIVVRADGTVSGPATLQSVISALDPNHPGSTWSANVVSSVGVIAPPAPPGLAGLSAAWTATTITAVNPFAQLTISDGVPNQPATIAITLRDNTLGRMTNASAGTIDPSGGTFVMTGTIDVIQATVRQLTFTAARAGTEHFTLTLSDGNGGVAQDASTAVTITQPASPDPLFDPVYYLAHNPDVAAAGVDPYMHYMTYGWKEGRNPSALFDTRFYETSNPDVAAAGINPLQHYEAYGWREGRQPSLLFSDSAYLSANPDVAAANINPLLHYTLYGQHEGRQAFLLNFDGNLGKADPLVDAAYFDAQLGATLIPAGAAGQAQAAELYAASGWRNGLSPDAWFDSNYYLTQNPDVRAAGINPLLHFEAYGWKEGREPSLVFSDSKYLQAYPDVKAAGMDPLLHYVQYGRSEGRMAFLAGGTAAADPLVDAASYDHQLGATILPAGDLAAQQAASSYDTIGWRLGLNPDNWFNTAYYLSHNPDVAAAGIDPLRHYEVYGWKEGRNPSALFSPAKYLAAYPDIRTAGIDPLLSFVQSGQAQGRTAFSV